MTKQQIACPECGHTLEIDQLLYHQLEEQVRKEYSGKLATLEKQQQRLDETIAESVKKQLAKQKTDLENKLRLEISGESAETIRGLEEQLDKKSGEVKELNKLKTELAKVTREKDGLKEQVEAEAEQRINATVAEERTKIRSQVEKDMELKIADKD